MSADYLRYHSNWALTAPWRWQTTKCRPGPARGGHSLRPSLVIVLGLLSVLIATLSTVGIFLRHRTASLAEIQLRLAALEEMLAARPDGTEA